MSNLPIDDDLKKLFDEVTNGKGEGADTRAILVQLEGGMLKLVESVHAEGSDKDDFGPVLGKLFSASPTRSGYALYRLDSKSPAGLSEWLNCAYRPDGAKIREKMQYTLTQTSLMAGLSEQHFLETIYGGTAADFIFPQKLRNSRKHDYQNPQVSAKGKSAADAAGGSIGESRRQFDTRGASVSPTPIKATLSSAADADKNTSSTKPASADAHRPDFPSSMTEEGTQQTSTTVDEVEAPSTAEQEERPDFPTSMKEAGTGNESTTVDQVTAMASTLPADGDDRPDFPHSMTEAGTGNQSITMDKLAPPKADDAAPARNEDDVKMADVLSEEQAGTETANNGAVEKVEEASHKSGALSEIASITEPTQTTKEVNEEAAGSIAPSSHPNLGEDAMISGTEKAAPSLPKETETISAVPSASMASASAPGPSSSIGTGRGAQGSETDRERDLAQLKTQEDAARSAGPSGNGGPRAGLAWNDDVEPALRGLAEKRDAGSTAEWNLVVLRLDLSKEVVQLAVPPRMAQPGDIASVLSEATESAHGGTEPCYAFYAHPEAQKEGATATNVVLIYICPMHSTVRQRMIYSSNIVSLVTHASTFEGLQIVKRLEASDAGELTPEYIREALAPSDAVSTAATGAAAFTRPKRPGRK